MGLRLSQGGDHAQCGHVPVVRSPHPSHRGNGKVGVPQLNSGARWEERAPQDPEGRVPQLKSEMRWEGTAPQDPEGRSR